MNFEVRQDIESVLEVSDDVKRVEIEFRPDKYSNEQVILLVE